MSGRMQFKERASSILIIICFQAFNMSHGLSCSWEISHCDHEEVVCTDQESVVLNGKNPTVDHCFAIKDMEKNKLKNYEVKVEMLSLESNEGVNSGYLGIIFNFMDQHNYDFVRLEIHNSKLSPPKFTNQTSAFTSGYRLNGEYFQDERIQINKPIVGTIYHLLRVVVDNHSNESAKLYLDNEFVGSFQEHFASRSKGGVFVVNKFGSVGVFRNFEIMECRSFDHGGNCINESTEKLKLDETNLEGHWDAMKPYGMMKDGQGKVMTWFDLRKKYDVKANSVNRPRFVSSAINGFPAIDFTGANIGLVSDVKYSKAPGHPFTWIMAVKPKAGNTWNNIFSTADNNWDGLNINSGWVYHPIAASTDGAHGWGEPSNIRGFELPAEELTIYTVWYDGTNAKIYWGNTIKTENRPTNWNKGQIGFVSMGLGIQNTHHDYSGFIGEILAYDTALEASRLKKIIDAMTIKWTTGASWMDYRLGKQI